MVKMTYVDRVGKGSRRYRDTRYATYLRVLRVPPRPPRYSYAAPFYRYARDTSLV